MTGGFSARGRMSVEFDRVPVDLLERASQLPASTLHEAAGRKGVLPSAIRPVDAAMRVCGSALTVHSPAGDNLWLHRAVELARPGDVLVVFAGGAYEFGYWGEVLSVAAKARNLGGLIIDACVRDVAVLPKVEFPVFARGACIRGTGKDFQGLGFIGAPILLGDVTVNPGDLVVGDVDGVCAIPRNDAANIIAASEQREADEAQIMARLRAGELTMDIYGFRSREY